MNHLFRNFYLQLPSPKRKTFKQSVMERTGWSNSTFYYKSEHSNLTRLEFEAVQSIINLVKREMQAEQRFVERHYSSRY